MEGSVWGKGSALVGGGVGQTPPSDTMGYGQRARGLHPTGMHSCLANFFCRKLLKNEKELEGEIFLRQLTSHFRRIIGGLRGDTFVDFRDGFTVDPQWTLSTQRTIVFGWRVENLLMDHIRRCVNSNFELN